MLYAPEVCRHHRLRADDMKILLSPYLAHLIGFSSSGGHDTGAYPYTAPKQYCSRGRSDHATQGLDRHYSVSSDPRTLVPCHGAVVERGSSLIRIQLDI